MTDQKALGDANDGSTPDDVATLYSWANLHGAKYRDFSSSRAQAREEARLRVEEVQAAERKRQEEEAERKAQEEAQLAARLAAEAAEAARQAEAERLAEIARQAEAERQAVLAAQEAQRQAAQQRVWQPPPAEAYSGSYKPQFAANALSHTEADDFGPPAEDFRTFAAPTYMAEPNRAPAYHPASPAQAASNFQQGPPYAPPTQAPVGPPMAASQDGQFAEARREPQREQPPAPSQQQRPAPVQQPPYQQPAVAQPIYARPGYENPGYENRGQANRGQANPESVNPGYANPGYANPMYANPGYANSGYAAHPAQGSNAEHASVSQQPVVSAPSAQQAYPAYASPAYAAQTYPPAAADAYMTSSWPSAEQRDSREMRDPNLRPAWLAPELPPAQTQASAQNSTQSQYSAGTMQPGQSAPQGPPVQPMVSAPAAASVQGPVDDTLLGSRDRLASRWFALKSVFDPNATQAEPQQQQAPVRVPVLAVFSLAGGVGKTSIVAALGRALSSRGERVLLVDTATYGLLPFFFGARDQRPGQLRTFNPPTVSTEAPIQLLTLDPEGPAPADRQGEGQNADPNQRPQDQDWLLNEIIRTSRGSSRILIDLPTASGATTRRVLRMGPVVLVPVVPDMSSVVSVGAIESFFRNSANAGGKAILPYYVLNQFDYSLPLHLDVREILREQIGDRLLPFALRRNAAISEALAEGMTVMDYAPTATVAEDYASLAGWVRGLSAPATIAQRGVRWSER